MYLLYTVCTISFYRIVSINTSNKSCFDHPLRNSMYCKCYLIFIWLTLLLFNFNLIFIQTGIKPDPTSTVVSMDARLDPVTVLRDTSSNPYIPILVQSFSLFAISTSYTGFVLGLDSFFRDIFPARKTQDVGLYALCIIPPLLVSTTGASNMFVELLDSAGSYGITILFGAIPAVMAFKLRRKAAENNSKYIEYVQGGDPSLLAIFLSAAFIFVEKLVSSSFDT